MYKFLHVLLSEVANFGKRLVNESLLVYFSHDTIRMNLTPIQEELVC